MLEPLPSIERDCHYIVSIDTEVDAINVVCIERKRDRTRDHAGADTQLAVVSGDEHAGQTAGQVRSNLAELNMTDRLSRGQQRGKDDSRVRLACIIEVALEPAFVQWITKERAAPLLVGFRCGYPRNEALKVALLEWAEPNLGDFLLHAFPIASLNRPPVNITKYRPCPHER
jgi:hypothetical protein